jgi:hypothetical protein
MGFAPLPILFILIVTGIPYEAGFGIPGRGALADEETAQGIAVAAVQAFLLSWTGTRVVGTGGMVAGVGDSAAAHA